MQWKEVLIGAVVTLVVTVAAGVGTYYFTREPETAKRELLHYSIEQLAAFKGNTQNASLISVSISNDGGLAASDVVLSLDANSSEFKDYAISGRADMQLASESMKKKQASFTFKKIMPGESATVSIMQSAPEEPSVTLRSSESIGSKSPLPMKNKEKKDDANEFVKKFIPFLGVFAIGSVLFFPRLLRLASMHSASKNNMAFLLLHQGLTEQAENILLSAIHAGEDGVFAISNYACCVAAKGEFDKADRLIRSAEYHAYGNHEKGVVSFNKAIVHLLKGNKVEFYALLKESISLSGKKVKSYCKYSVHFDSVRGEKSFKDIVGDA